MAIRATVLMTLATLTLHHELPRAASRSSTVGSNHSFCSKSAAGATAIRVAGVEPQTANVVVR